MMNMMSICFRDCKWKHVFVFSYIRVNRRITEINAAVRRESGIVMFI